MKRFAGTLALVLLTAPPALAAPGRIAVVPLRDSSPGAGDAGPVESALVEALRATATLELVNANANGRLRGQSQVSAEARADPRAAARAQALGRETGVPRVLAVEVARLGDGRILYLQAIETASGRASGSTTVSLPAGPVLSAALRPALVRVLDPDRYRGRLLVRVDVPGAEVQIDGQIEPTGARGPVELSVGTHALRVTHPAHRDFLRFVDVEFDKTEDLYVALSAYPLTEGEMSERQRRRAVPRAYVPWWRSWWALSLSAAVVTGVTAGAIYGARPSVAFDRSVTFQAPAKP